MAVDAQDWEEARACFTQALRLFKQLGDYKEVATLLGNLTALSRLSGGLDVADSVSSTLGLGRDLSASLVHDIGHPDGEDRFGKFNRLSKLMVDASAAYENGQLQESVDLLTAALDIDPELLDAYYNRSVARQFLGDYLGVVADTTKIIRRNPQAGRTYFNRGNARRELGDIGGALADFDRAIELDPD